ncbi:MAG: serine/threonine protein kinase [Symploca sp. SIO2G7]|nr:serine/threonine protein kinase [Symploca sp. SIO2G7]
MEALHKPGEIIAKKYQISGILGNGGTGTTYAAQDQNSSQRVAVKELSLLGMRDWKVLELFEREAQVLSSLNHPAIPNYLNYFQVDTAENRWFYIIQELAVGKSLASLMEQGWQPNEATVKKLAIQVLKILHYLHHLSPPIIHRDIKPQNLICNQKGKVFLVDFGAVQNVYRNTLTQGSTVVGSYGYMAPEQFRGQAYPTSDLYSLGATLLFLLTHRSPADLPQRRLKIDFRSQVKISPQFADWLEKMLEPVAEDRFTSAEEALAALRGKAVTVKKKATKQLQFPGSRITLSKSINQLVLDIPPMGWQSQQQENLFRGAVISFLLAVVVIFSFSSLASSSLALRQLLSLAGATILFCVPVILWMFIKNIFRLTGHIHLEIDRQSFQLQWTLLSQLKWKLLRQSYWRKGRTMDINWIELDTRHKANGEPITACVVVEGARTHRFGKWLTSAQKEWLVQQVNSFLEEVRSHSTTGERKKGWGNEYADTGTRGRGDAEN